MTRRTANVVAQALEEIHGWYVRVAPAESPGTWEIKVIRWPWLPIVWTYRSVPWGHLPPERVFALEGIA